MYISDPVRPQPPLVSTVSSTSASGGPGSRVHPSSSFRSCLNVPVGTQDDPPKYGAVISAFWASWESANMNVPSGSTALWASPIVVQPGGGSTFDHWSATGS